jgi:hypothetical protein
MSFVPKGSVSPIAGSIGYMNDVGSSDLSLRGFDNVYSRIGLGGILTSTPVFSKRKITLINFIERGFSNTLKYLH